MNKFLLSFLLIIAGCATAETDRPYSPELILTMEDHIDWLHGQKINFSSVKREVLVSVPVNKYSSRGQLNKDKIALGIGKRIGFWEKQFLTETLSLNEDAIVIDPDTEFLIIGSYTFMNKHWWDRLDSYKQRMLIVENDNKERFVLLYFYLASSNKPNLYERESTSK